jgi:hypothetical protein
MFFFYRRKQVTSLISVSRLVGPCRLFQRLTYRKRADWKYFSFELDDQRQSYYNPLLLLRPTHRFEISIRRTVHHVASSAASLYRTAKLRQCIDVGWGGEGALGTSTASRGDVFTQPPDGWVWGRCASPLLLVDCRRSTNFIVIVEASSSYC